MMTFQKVLTKSTKIDVFKEPVHRYKGFIRENPSKPGPVT